MQAAADIINNRAMTPAQKEAALDALGGLQQSMKEGLGETISPMEANQIKQELGDRINWTGTSAIGDEVKPAYRALYGSLKNAVNNAVPEMAPLNERLTNLYAAQQSLKRVVGVEEVGQGKGALGSAVTGIARRAEAIAGRPLPFIATMAKGGRAIAPIAVPATPGMLSGIQANYPNPAVSPVSLRDILDRGNQ